MSDGSRIKHEYIEATLSGEFSEPPILKRNITLKKISIYDHHRFACGWIKSGRNMRVFENVNIVQRKAYTRGAYGVQIGRVIGGYYSTKKDTTHFSAYDIELLEGRGVFFDPNESYTQIKNLAYILNLGTNE